MNAADQLSSVGLGPFLTVTGADERTDVVSLAKLDAEIGLLFTATPEGRNRYPRWEWIHEASYFLPRASLHVCGRGARAMLAEGRLDVGPFQRIQVNGAISKAEVERLCSTYRRHTIITQHNPENLHLLEVAAGNHAVLVDASGGQGKSPVGWSCPVTSKPVGFAGGLGPENLLGELGRIEAIARPGWWADMEGKLRENDWFSVTRAAECVSIFRAFVSRLPNGGDPATAATVDDLAILVRRLAHEIRRSNPNSVCAVKAMDYLARCGLKTSPLRVLPPALSE